MSSSGPLNARRQDGFSLIVSLMMLIVIIILGVSGAQMAVNEERGARNDRDRQIAYQAAEAALQDGESEILSTTFIAGCPARTPGRPGTPPVCFNESSGVTFAPNSLYACSVPPSEGLCDGTNAPAYMSSTVDFFADAKGVGNNNTVAYGRFSGRTFPAQSVSGLSGQPISRYPPRYIIERIVKNVSLPDTPGKFMFRVTAMGFGANANAQVVLQSVVSTGN